MHMIERQQIEGQSVEILAKMLRSAYDKYCGEKIGESVEIYDPVAELQITVEEARERILANPELDLLDIREPDEIEKGKIEGALTVDDELADQIISTWSREREIIVYCERGKSSLEATQFLRQKGLQNVRSLKGGFSVWSAT